MINKREENLRILKLAAEGKLTAEDIIFKGEPVFDICLDLHGTGNCFPDLSPEEKRRLKAQGRYFDITLDLTKS